MAATNRTENTEDMTQTTTATMLHLQQAASAGVKGHLSAEKCKSGCRMSVGGAPRRPFAVITSPSLCKLAHTK